MKSKNRRPAKQQRPKRQHFVPGQAVAALAGTLENAGPMDRLIVTNVHRDGTVDLEATTGLAWQRVDPEPLLLLEP